MKKSFKKSVKTGSWWNPATKKLIAVITIIIIVITAFMWYNNNYSTYLTATELQGSDLVFVVKGNEYHWKLEDGDRVVTGECSVTLKTKGSSDPKEWEIVNYHQFCH